MFTPLEKAADFNRRSTDSQAEGGLMPPSALTVREQRSLTGFTENEQKVVEIIHSALNLKDKMLTLESKMNAVEEWDSLGHLGILSALDKFFDGQVAPIKEMATADSVKKILRILKDNSLI